MATPVMCYDTILQIYIFLYILFQRKQDFAERQKEVEIGNIALATAVPKQKGDKNRSQKEKKVHFNRYEFSYNTKGAKQGY